MKKINKKRYMLDKRKYFNISFKIDFWIVVKFDPILLIYKSFFETKRHIKIKQVSENPIRKIKRTILYANKLVQALFVTIEEIKTYRSLKSGEKSEWNQTRYLSRTKLSMSNHGCIILYHEIWTIISSMGQKHTNSRNITSINFVDKQLEIK